MNKMIKYKGGDEELQLNNGYYGYYDKFFVADKKQGLVIKKEDKYQIFIRKKIIVDFIQNEKHFDLAGFKGCFMNETMFCWFKNKDKNQDFLIIDKSNTFPACWDLDFQELKDECRLMPGYFDKDYFSKCYFRKNLKIETCIKRNDYSFLQ